MSQANTNAAETTAPAAAAVPAPVVPKEPSKMELARPIFKEVNDPAFELPEGKSARATFIARAQAEVGLTDKGAATYWQNLTKEAKGEPLYGKRKAKEVPPAEAQAAGAASDAEEAANANAELEQAEEQAEEPVAEAS